MGHDWHDNAPIYRQLKDKVVNMILNEELKSGEALPSVRQIAAEFQLNPITVSRAYQELVDESIVEMKRGLGMFVLDGAKERLLESERARFMSEEWPALLKRIENLGIDIKTLLKQAKQGE
ncbi:GntR family transcriptional regulator [Undibacterium cyanobacteriorum]|uniref:GntR family transcriptional regulator n=1 Tax=Undibacterium cyanobacteriorum TaxID=3073561 RepID=A0ABY9RHM8_9BURK|nr:GntR family transcriptional regulator [Undibacterium sp. 20NA77.5]WMW79601.1 GntR family transcriptional regulator [Undibacterium sp. 20NA77.5]